MKAEFRSDIEGLRAIAVLGVVAFHAGVPHLGGGYVGVDVFYVISGFLITQLMLREWRGDSAPQLGGFLGGFYARRARRILPAATLVMLATLVGALIVQNAIENANVAGDARSTSLFFANFRFAHQASDYFAAGNAPSPYLQYWSLSVEEQFYLLWPLVMFVLMSVPTRRGRSRAVLGAGLGALVVASFALSVLTMRTDPVHAFYLLPHRAWELGIGALLAVGSSEPPRLPPGGRWLFGLVGLTAILGSMVLFTPATPFPGWTALPATIGTMMVIAGGREPLGPVYRVLRTWPMQRIGRYSYSLYLWHWVFIALKVEHFKWIYATWTTRSAFVVLVSFPAAALTYHLVENPLRQAASLRATNRRSLVFGLLLIAGGLAGIAVFQRLATKKLSTDRLVPASRGLLAQAIDPTDFVPANLVPPLADSRARTYVHCGRPCLVGPARATHRIVVFGDSHAGHLAAAFEAAASRLDATVEIDSLGGCTSFLIPVDLLPLTDKLSCGAWRQRQFAAIEARPPDLVVFSNSDLEVFASHRDTWEKGVQDALARIPKQTTAVVLAETPHAPRSIPLCLSHHLAHAEQCDQRWPDEINRHLALLAKEHGAVFVDMRPMLCTKARCPAITQDLLIYGDTNHFTVPYSRALGPKLAGALASWVAKPR